MLNDKAEILEKLKEVVLQYFLKAASGVTKLKFRLDDSILGHDHHRMLLFVWIHSYYEIPPWNLFKFLRCAIFHSMAPPMLDI